MSAGGSSEAREEAVRGLESEFGELFVHVRHMLAENAHRLSPGLLPAAYKVFTTIVHAQSVTLSALAERLHADKGQLSRTVRELTDLGLVTRTTDPADRRSSVISPTQEGLERLRAAREPRERQLATALAEWSIDDIQDLTRLIHALSQAASGDSRRRGLSQDGSQS